MTDPLHAELLELAREAARRAGELLRDGRPADLAVAATKSSSVDVVTEMDLAAEKLITALIAERRPEDGILGEEGASTARQQRRPLGRRPPRRHGELPVRPAHLGRLRGGRAGRRGRGRRGVRPDARGGVPRGAGRRAWATGAWEGERRLACRPSPPLDQALVSTGFNYVADVREQQAEVARRLIPLVRDIRRGGSAAIDLCDVAAGRLDGYYERGLHPWDVAAGALIARESGALTTGRHPDSPPSAELTVAASPGVLKPLLGLLEECGA